LKNAQCGKRVPADRRTKFSIKNCVAADLGSSFDNPSRTWICSR
jgi:hypothetical protein